MLPGLQQGQEKMSKSDPLSSIFMEDDEAEVNLKIKKAYCPPKIVEGNPCLEYVKYLILPWFKEFIVERNAENGGHKTFTSFEELIADYESGELHPADLKPALSKALNKILEPVREHFKKDSNAKDLLERVEADICQLGMDQRKVNVLAREYCDDIKRKNKPIILPHHLLPGLLQGQEKMSKSDPSSIFMEDDEAEVNLKLKKAYCPPKIVEGNPCLEYVKYLILPWFKEFIVERNAKNGGHKTFTSFEELIADYESGELHPVDLKPALSKALNKILEPVREHFKKDSNAKDLLERV
ncbi:hypothetical protein FH972_015720 [Carpinus fangiana]|uniref:tyrosine--tRNA ligase n=1 Tax=Carpinus fangiana TaxID=176857 RepID=A0A5N6RDN1_9ROSI|nr:hypothetical protein FH972_015720 [Carpinus fangiana]